MFKIICNIALSQTSLIDPATALTGPVIDTINYVDCTPCNPHFLLTEGSKSFSSADAGAAILARNNDGLNPFSSLHPDAYKHISTNGPLSQYRYIALIEEHSDLIPWLKNPLYEIGFLHESIISTASGEAWGESELVAFKNKPTYKTGVLKEISSETDQYVYAFDDYFLKHLAGKDKLTCTPLEEGGSADSSLDAIEHDQYAQWLKAELKHKLSNMAAKHPHCIVDGKNVIVKNSGVQTNTKCAALGGTLSTTKDVIDVYCKHLSDDAIVIKGNSLYTVTCDNYEDFC